MGYPTAQQDYVVMVDSSTTQNLSNKDRYCIEICKAKCCYTIVGGRCPNLAKDNKCSIYHLWEDNTCHYSGYGLKTSSIEYAIEHKLLRPEIMEGCCYAHPELLEKLNGI